MNGKWLSRLLMLFLLAIWGISIAAVVKFFSQLDAVRLSGPAIIGLLFIPLLILGVWSEIPEYPTAHDVWRGFRKFWLVLGVILIGFCGGLWLLLVMLSLLWPAWLPTWLQLPLYVIAASWYVAGLIKFFMWLAPRLESKL